MNKSSKKIVWLGIIAGVYLIASRVSRVVRNLAWRFTGVSVIASNNETNSATVRVGLQLRNSTPVSVLLNSIVGEIYIQGVRVGSVNQAYNMVIQRESITNLDIIFELFWSGMAQAIKTNVLSGDIRNLNFQFVGYLEVEGHKINLNQVITFQDLVE